MQAAEEFFHVSRCCGHVWELLPVDDGSVEEVVHANLIGGSLLVDLLSSMGSTVSTL